MSKHKTKSSKEKHHKKSKSSPKKKKSKKSSKSLLSKNIEDEDVNEARHKVKSCKRKRTHSSESSTSYSSSSSNDRSSHKKAKKKTKEKVSKKVVCDVEVNEETDMNVPLDLMGPSAAMRPQTREEWQKKQEQIKRVLDPETGRYRLIKGEGEVLEEIVSKTQHKEINKKATAFDGHYFESHTVMK